MPDDKSKRDGADRPLVSENEPYEVAYFAEKHGISRVDARVLIEEHGNNREVLDQAAEKFKAAAETGN